MYKFSQRSLDKLRRAHNELQTIMISAIKDSPYDFGIICSYRSSIQQYELFKKGRDEQGNIIDKGKVVTYKDGYHKKSKHNVIPSPAVDIMCYDENGKATWEHKYYETVAEHIQEVADKLFEDDKVEKRLVWGGNWKNFTDLPHFQI